MQQKTVEVAGRDRPYEIQERATDAALLILLTDAPSAARDFAVRTDLPFGIVVVPLEGVVAPRDRELVIAIADAERVDECIVMGSGVGAPLALVAAAEAPHRVRAAVVADPRLDAGGRFRAGDTRVRWDSTASLWDIAGTVRCPVLILRREGSDSFSTDALDRLRAALASSFTQSVRASHDDLVAADPAFVTRAIRFFLVGRR